jgi:hypothetical protein
MRRRFHPRPSASFVIAVIALFLALGGTTVAAVVINGANIKNGTVTGNKLKNGTLTGTQIKKDSLTGTQIKESSLSQVPRAKNADTVGGQAPGSFEPASKWALIAGNATGANILAQSGGLSVTRFAAGVYLVASDSSVVSKPLSATFNFLSAGFISVAPCGGSANNPGGINCPLFNNTDHVIVRTLNTAAAPVDSTFYVSIGG